MAEPIEELKEVLRRFGEELSEAFEDIQAPVSETIIRNDRGEL